VPINVFWQNWLEATFPGSKPAPAAAQAKGEKKKPSEQKTVRDVKNIVIKFLMDQTVGAAINIPLFLGTIGAVKGQSVDYIVNTIREVSSLSLFLLIPSCLSFFLFFVGGSGDREKANFRWLRMLFRFILRALSFGRRFLLSALLRFRLRRESSLAV
jgi:hypothetical protein